MFALIWLAAALDELADIFVGATLEEQDRLTAAIEALNNRLQSDPLNEGESRTGGYRITFPFHLAVVFHVSLPNRTVRVVSVKRYGA